MAKKAAAIVVAPPAPESATTQVNIADFQRTRDSVIVALATLQTSVQDLSRAYINHANTVLAPGRGGELSTNLTDILSGSGLLSGTIPAQPIAIVETDLTGDGKKKRKRVPHDPNAPKRALTPYFLYMQSARTQIAKELGDNAKPKEVADEGTRRWTEMNQAEKSVWDDLYQKNFSIYKVKTAAYKAGQDIPSDEEAARLVASGKAALAVTADADHEEETEAAEEEEDETSPEPVREPTPPKSKRRKSEKAVSPVAKETPKSAAKASTTKSKKGAAKKEASPVPEPASSSKPAEKKKRGKKA